MLQNPRAFARQIGVVACGALLVFVVGCNHDKSASSIAKVDLTAANAQIGQPAWLDARLPEHTVAYARIPSLWGMLSAPDGRPLDPALAGSEHTKIIATLRDAARTDPLLAQSGAAPWIALFLGDQVAPVEMAAVDLSDQLTPAANVLMTTRLDVSDIASLNARMTALSDGKPFLKAPFDANGSAELPRMGFLQFDLSSKRLYVFAGTGASRAGLDQLVKQVASTRSHPMQAIESTFDSNGQGLFVWIKLKGIASLMDAKLATLPPGNIARDLVDHSQSLAFGWGTVSGHGRLQIQLDAPDARLLSYLAPGTIAADIKTTGKPNWVATLALPGPEQITAIEANLDQDYGPGTHQKYDQLMARATAKVGLKPTDFLRTIGPELLFFSDANGSFAALRMRDRAAFQSQLDGLGKRFGWHANTISIDGTTIHQLQVPNFASAMGTGQGDASARIFSRLQSHYYWVDDGDYLIFASVPQLLLDRAASKPDVSLAKWLHDVQPDQQQTLLGLSGTSKHVQRDMYYAYMQLLQGLGDVLGKPVEIATLPAAHTLNLPENGNYDVSIEATESRFALSLGYEQSPIEIVTHGASETTTVAVVAILAAIAVPAYQDYIIRSQVSEGASLADGAKTAVSEAIISTGKMPANNAAAGLDPADQISGAYVSSVSVEAGIIEAHYSSEPPQSANKALDGGVLAFTPRLDHGNVQWTCASANIPAKYLPSVCR